MSRPFLTLAVILVLAGAVVMSLAVLFGPSIILSVGGILFTAVGIIISLIQLNIAFPKLSSLSNLSSLPPRQPAPPISTKQSVSRRIFIESLTAITGMAIIGSGIFLLVQRLRSPQNAPKPTALAKPIVTPTVSPRDDLTWTNHQLIRGAASNLAPALAVRDNALSIAYTDTKNSNLLTLASSKDGMNWTGRPIIGQASSTAPALAVWHNTLYITFASNDEAQLLLFVTSGDGATWTNNQLTGQESQMASALTVWNGRLYMAYAAYDISTPYPPLLLVSTQDGVNWIDNQFIHGAASSQTPALAVWDNALCMAYVDTKNGNRLMLVSSRDGMNWTGSPTIGQASSTAPALAVWHNTLYITFVENNPARRLLMISSKDGVNWTSSRSIGQSSPVAPALAIWNDRLYVAFVMNDDSHDLLLVSSKG